MDNLTMRTLDVMNLTFRRMKILLWTVFGLLALLSCTPHGEKTVLKELDALVESVRSQYVPDSRDDVFEITVAFLEDKPLVKGVTSVAEAKAVLQKRIHEICPDAVDSIQVLPDKSVGDLMYAVAKVSVADLRTETSYAAEMATQLLLGFHMQVLQIRQGWCRVKTPEGYVAWISGSSVVRMNQESFHSWQSAPHIIFTGDYGFAYETPDENGQRVSDLVFGNLMKWEGDAGRFYLVSFPDERRAYVLRSQNQHFDTWKASIRLTEESIVNQAFTLKGIPYTWGGTSVKSMDCSGFVKTVYLKHGIILRRDASQQVKTGIPVDISNGYANLRPGDLLFFGRSAEGDKAERIRHVGIYIGNREFIHAAGLVHISSFDPERPNYDEGNTKEFIHARRILGAVGMEGVGEWLVIND
jgi:hypothetical protein